MTSTRALTDALAVPVFPDRKLASFGNALRMGRSVNLGLVGDSKGYDNSGAAPNWFRQLANICPSLAPANTQLNYYQYNTTTQAWNARTVLQAGNEPYHAFKTGATGQNAAREFNPVIIGDLTGSIEIELDLASDAVPPAALSTLIGRQGGLNLRGFTLKWLTNGNLSYDIYPTTSDTPTFNATVTAAQWAASANPPVAGSRSKLKVSHTKDNGAGGFTIQFFTAAAGSDTWTEITAAAVVNTSAGAQGVGNPSGVKYQLGARSSTTELFQGKIYEALIRDGIAGRIMTPQPIDAWLPIAANLLVDAERGGVGTINFWNASYPGAQGTWFIARPNMWPSFQEGVLLLSTCDNETTYDATLGTAMDNFLTAARGYYPKIPIGIASMNGPLSAFSNYNSSYYKAMYIQRWAVINGLSLIDVFNAFARLSDRGLSLLKADQQHLTDGSPGSDGAFFASKIAQRTLGLLG